MLLTQILEHTRGRLERLGNAVTSAVWRLGFASRFLFYTVLHSATALRRFRLTVAEIYFAGVLSLIIIMVSGLFVPTLAGLLWKRATAEAAFWSTTFGGGTAVLLSAVPALDPFGEPVLVAMPVSAVVMVGLSLLRSRPEAAPDVAPAP